MEISFKILHFEYVISKLLKWQFEITGKHENDLSTLKALKLLFFVSTVRTHPSNENSLIANVFDNYAAMPYGHVESSIYEYLKINKGNLNYFKIDNSSTNPKQGIEIVDAEISQQIDLTFKKEIDLSIAELKKINPLLISLSAFSLVDISHSWYSWKKYYSLAKLEQVKSYAIPNEEIVLEDKIYSEQIF
jgi:uncharacterized phage-associated protein